MIAGAASRSAMVSNSGTGITAARPASRSSSVSSSRSDTLAALEMMARSMARAPYLPTRNRGGGEDRQFAGGFLANSHGAAASTGRGLASTLTQQSWCAPCLLVELPDSPLSIPADRRAIRRPFVHGHRYSGAGRGVARWKPNSSTARISRASAPSVLQCLGLHRNPAREHDQIGAQGFGPGVGFGGQP